MTENALLNFLMNSIAYENGPPMIESEPSRKISKRSRQAKDAQVNARRKSSPK